MTIDEAVASGWFDLPDEPSMVRIPVSIDVMIPNHILFPPQPPEKQYDPDDPSGMAEDDGDARRRHAVGAIAGSFGTMFGPAADADRAAFREMLKATPSGRGQGFPTLPVAEPIDTTDVHLPRIIVGGAPSGDARAKPAAAVDAPVGLVPATAKSASGFPAAQVKTVNRLYRTEFCWYLCGTWGKRGGGCQLDPHHSRARPKFDDRLSHSNGVSDKTMSHNLIVSGQLFGSHFHQDWVDEFCNESEAIKAMIAGETRDRLDEASREIRALLHSSLTEEELREVMTNLVGCYFEPSSRGMSYRQWLGDVLNQLR